jgi:ABC-2 type transport system ATP-binding protein
MTEYFKGTNSLSTENSAIVRVDHLTKAFDDQLAVDDLSFGIQGGEIAGLVGPNGAGKTTTLRALAGVIAPTGGNLLVGGFDVVTHPVEAKRRLALVPHDPHLFGSLTVWEHVEFSAKVYGVADFEPKARSLLERFKLDDRMRAMGDELSRGMQQKVALTCALLHDPVAMLLDEPLTGLDPHGIRTVFDLLQEQAAAGSAIIISSHLLDQVERTCSTFIILQNGGLRFRGTKAEIRENLPHLRADASLEELFFQATEENPVSAQQ